MMTAKDNYPVSLLTFEDLDDIVQDFDQNCNIKDLIFEIIFCMIKNDGAAVSWSK